MAENDLKKAAGFHGGSAAADHAQCLMVLDEFVRDIEAAHGIKADTLEADWPDLHITYRKARTLVRDE